MVFDVRLIANDERRERKTGQQQSKARQAAG